MHFLVVVPLTSSIELDPGAVGSDRRANRGFDAWGLVSKAFSITLEVEPRWLDVRVQN